MASGAGSLAHSVIAVGWNWTNSGSWMTAPSLAAQLRATQTAGGGGRHAILKPAQASRAPGRHRSPEAHGAPARIKTRSRCTATLFIRDEARLRASPSGISICPGHGPNGTRIRRGE